MKQEQKSPDTTRVKFLHIRFFSNFHSIIPMDSILVCTNTPSTDCQTAMISCYNDAIQSWMDEYLEGKVDFVWS